MLGSFLANAGAGLGGCGETGTCVEHSYGTGGAFAAVGAGVLVVGLVMMGVAPAPAIVNAPPAVVNAPPAGEGTNVLGEVPGYNVPGYGVPSQGYALANTMVRHRRRLADDLAVDLERVAEQAAATGDCATVREMDKLALALGADIYRARFAANATIQHCLAPPAPLEPPP